MFSKNKDKPAPAMDKPLVRSGSSVPSIIGSDIRILGNVTTPGEVQLDGVIEGDIVCGQLTIGEHGLVTGTVKAERIVLRGRIEGKLRAKTINFERTAKVKGDVTYDTMTMEAGVQVDGKLIPMRGKEPPPRQDKPQIQDKPKQLAEGKNGNSGGGAKSLV